ncbi:MAG TPA: ribose-phosphate diphosphokinase, partial [Novosphingobium sp.]|nr:ribose-phosphate diphosphokinase [Novosphingobium sp.]
MSTALFAFADGAGPAAGLADLCGIALHRVDLRRFPDGESLVRVTGAADTALLFRSLDDPNAKLVELLLAASALRDGGARRVVLVAPYLAYMRQDMAFHPGEAVSQRVIGQLLADAFDGVVTVDPHLHRIASLGEAVPGIPALALSAAPAIAAAIASDLDPATLLVGPDSESRPWVESIARPLGLDVLVGEKVRHGDREVALGVPGCEAARGRPVMLVDDLISSGTTLVACARLL